MIHYDWPGYSGGTAKLAADKVIVKLNDVIAKWMPNLNRPTTPRIPPSRGR